MKTYQLDEQVLHVPTSAMLDMCRECWRLGDNLTERLLGIPTDELRRFRQIYGKKTLGELLGSEKEIATRAAILLMIVGEVAATLSSVDDACTWMRWKNTGQPFDGETPLAYMIEHGLSGFIATLDAARKIT